MFLQINGKVINTNFIEIFDENAIYFHDVKSPFPIHEADYIRLKGILVSDESFISDTVSVEVKHRPSELGTFLTQLHQLLGGRGEAKLTTDRKARLTTRLKDFSKEELVQAATNLGNDEFMQGGNDSGKRYGTIDYLLRTSANVNKWLEDQPEKKKSMF